jgi:hypothetical protein
MSKARNPKTLRGVHGLDEEDREWLKTWWQINIDHDLDARCNSLVELGEIFAARKATAVREALEQAEGYRMSAIPKPEPVGDGRGER